MKRCVHCLYTLVHASMPRVAHAVLIVFCCYCCAFETGGARADRLPTEQHGVGGGRERPREQDRCVCLCAFARACARGYFVLAKYSSGLQFDVFNWLVWLFCAQAGAKIICSEAAVRAFVLSYDYDRC